MGWGDQLIATGLARGARARGKRVAFGDGRSIIWDQHSAPIFRGNRNIAPPGAERDRNLEWVAFYKGHRLYNRQGSVRWIWNHGFRVEPGEITLDAYDLRNRERAGRDFVVIEPHVEAWKRGAVNKDWGLARYQLVADQLRAQGHQVVQFRHPGGGPMLNGVQVVDTHSFRDAVGLLSRARLYIGPEGGLHHGAAAVGTAAVVIFGGWIPPQITGYAGHANLTGGAANACGLLRPCSHCRAALNAITPDQVLAAAREKLSCQAAA